MNEVQLNLNEKGHGAFYIMSQEKSLGEMVVSVADKTLTVYHTEVAAEMEGQGLAKKMLDEMVGYARRNGLQVVPLCPYVHAQFKRHPEAYADVWQAGQADKA
jgi:uncharacterized protein